MKPMTIEQAIKYLKDFKKNLCPGTQLYVKVFHDCIGIYSDAECTRIEASL